MKGLISLFIAFLPLFSIAFSQNTSYYTLTTGEKYTQAQLEAGLQMCDLTRYVQREKRVKMPFDDGAIVELYSAYELDEQGIPIDHAKINTTGNELMNTFSIHPKGYIVEHVKKWTKEELANRHAK